MRPSLTLDPVWFLSQNQSDSSQFADPLQKKDTLTKSESSQRKSSWAGILDSKDLPTASRDSEKAPSSRGPTGTYVWLIIAPGHPGPPSVSSSDITTVKR